MIEFHAELQTNVSAVDALGKLKSLARDLQLGRHEGVQHVRWQSHGTRIQVQLTAMGVESRWRADVQAASVAITGLVASSDPREGRILSNRAMAIVADTLERGVSRRRAA